MRSCIMVVCAIFVTIEGIAYSNNLKILLQSKFSRKSSWLFVLGCIQILFRWFVTLKLEYYQWRPKSTLWCRRQNFSYRICSGMIDSFKGNTPTHTHTWLWYTGVECWMLRIVLHNRQKLVTTEAVHLHLIDESAYWNGIPSDFVQSHVSSEFIVSNGNSLLFLTCPFSYNNSNSNQAFYLEKITWLNWSFPFLHGSFLQRAHSIHSD